MNHTLDVLIIILIILFLRQVDGHGCCIDGFAMVRIIIIIIMSFTAHCCRSITSLQLFPSVLRAKRLP